MALAGASANSSKNINPNGLNPNITRITPVPLLTSLQTIPPLSDKEIKDARGWMDTDLAYERRLGEMKDRMTNEVRAAFGTGFGPGQGPAGGPGPSSSGAHAHTGSSVGWWDKPTTGNMNKWRRPVEQFQVRNPRIPKRERDGFVLRRKGVKREGFRLPRSIDPEDANRPELLVPIRIEFDVDHHKMRDTFVWNLNDPVITPEVFAQSLGEDYGLSQNWLSVISKSIHDQLTDYKSHLMGYDPETSQFIEGLVDPARVNPLMKGKLEADDAEWWTRWRKSLKRNGKAAARKKGRRKKVKDEEGTDVDMAGDEMDDGSDGEDEYRPLSLEEFKVDERTVHEDMRILIKLDILVSSLKLEDQFEWDLDNPDASPEDFAEVYTQELGLGGEFKTAIVHSIREQVQAYQKSLFLVGHPDSSTAQLTNANANPPTNSSSNQSGNGQQQQQQNNSSVQDDDLKSSFLPPLTQGARPVSEVITFTPMLNYLSDNDLERYEKERDKDISKRRKRNTRGRRGVALPDRDPIRTYRTPAIGFPEPDAATLAAAAATNAPTSRRAAAHAASLTIATMAAKEAMDSSPTLETATLPAMQQHQHHMMATLSAPPLSSGPTQAQLNVQQQQQRKKKDQKGLFKGPTYPPSVLRPRASVSAPTESTAVDGSVLESADREGERSISPSPGSGSRNQASSGGAGASGPGVVGSGGGDRSRGMTAKRAKELEREAKEKEFVDGQHPNYIDGVWHCSNCGCPESIAIGRRKGPLGDKSQCGTCGKFWHRHRRPRPVDYNPDPAYHSGIAKGRDQEPPASTPVSKTPVGKKKGGAAARAQAEREREREKQKEKQKYKDLDDRAMSPVSSASSGDEAPLAQQAQTKGRANGHAKSTSVSAAPGTPAASASSPVKASSTEVQARAHGSATPSASAGPVSNPSLAAGTTASGAVDTTPPAWLLEAMAAIQRRLPHDRFEATLRKVNPNLPQEWRIKCLDCPGKLYTPGPNETLANYDVHLRNRQHRQRVTDRLIAAGIVPPPAAGSTPGSANGATPTTSTAGATSSSAPRPTSAAS